ncbi:hypothetical protein ACFFHH_24630 [Cytobacillus solani]|uniref:Uncharacterized protein n=1 Tax=Cytobacillus solani TaxID=1637975 RepID=A0A0Q3VGR6_9BACI|nr:hypothetical protein [Cytobacillus solani]KOP81863.1 hypothetical protein AMS60_04825 [Bacillus sp. FJAT-21945]KQL18802.1 hypothetical protein AN957_09595 [Cytobacillus solani]USK56789.1 hypothetical protein LIS82_10090 [Cytobacillus solani]
MKKLVDPIEHFEKMLQKYPDEKKNTYEFYSFFKDLPLANQSFDYVPIIELGTIFKYKKPKIFFEMRKFSSKSYVIDLITSSETDLQRAIDIINKMKNQ